MLGSRLDYDSSDWRIALNSMQLTFTRHCLLSGGSRISNVCLVGRYVGVNGPIPYTSGTDI